MPTTVFWSPNQATVAQVETVTLVGVPSVGNTFTATINGKSVTYTATATDTTAALFATGLYNLLVATTSIAAEFTEIQFANPSAGVITATARTPGTPFANVTGNTAGLVFSTGNGYGGTCTTVHTTPNASPSDVNDSQNWLRVTTPAPGVRQLPQNGDDMVIASSNVPLLWNLDRLKTVTLNTYTRYQSFTATVGLPENNPGGYTEWRATYFWFNGPQGSVPAGGLTMILGQGAGNGPARERYNLQSSQYTLTALAAGQPADEYGIRMLGVHTANTFTAVGGVSIGFATSPGEIAGLSSSTIDGNATVGIGAGVTWTAASTLTAYSGSVLLASAPATINGNNGTQFTFDKDALTWATVTMRGGCNMTWLCGGTITTLTMETGANLDKSQDARALIITNSTIDGDTCQIIDPLNAVSYTNATTVKQQVTTGSFVFTGSRTVKVV